MEGLKDVAFGIRERRLRTRRDIANVALTRYMLGSTGCSIDCDKLQYSDWDRAVVHFYEHWLAIGSNRTIPARTL